MSFDVFVNQKKVTPQIEAFLRGQVTDQQKPFDLSKASPSAKLIGGWVDDMIKVATEKLQRDGTNASNQLSQSIKLVPIDLREDTLTIGIEMNGYWKFVDLGVKGTRESKKAPESPFKRGVNAPFARPRDIQQWIAFKGIPLQGRDKPVTAEQLSFAISRSVNRTGTKPTRFFSDSLTPDKINVLAEDIATAIGKQIGVALQL